MQQSRAGIVTAFAGAGLLVYCGTAVVRQCDDFSCMTALLTRYQYLKPLGILRSAQGCCERDRWRVRQRLARELNRQAYEPLWRELYDSIVASQEGYPAND